MSSLARLSYVFAQGQRPSLYSLIQVNIEHMIWPTINGMTPQLLAAAYFLQRLHGSAFAAALLEDNGVPSAHALRLLADRPGADERQQHIRHEKCNIKAAASSENHCDDGPQQGKRPRSNI
jgi:hypothetical protein